MLAIVLIFTLTRPLTPPPHPPPRRQTELAQRYRFLVEQKQHTDMLERVGDGGGGGDGDGGGGCN